MKVISGDDESQSLADGLREDIVGSLAKQTAISVLDIAPGEGAGREGSSAGVNFRLEGSVRAVGQRLRLSFSLIDIADQHQTWSERYDRQMDDILDLEDEISESVASAVRLRIKASAFEKLRSSDNATLPCRICCPRRLVISCTPTLTTRRRPRFCVWRWNRRRRTRWPPR